MHDHTFSRWVVVLVSVALVSLSLAQTAGAGIISTQQVLQDNERQTMVSRIKANLAEESVASQLAALGVSTDLIDARIDQLTTTELVRLDTTLQSEVAGADAVSIIGAVFIVLLVLEVVGVIDIFKGV